MIFDDVRKIAAPLPGMEEGPCYGTPAFRMRKRLIARLKEDGETLVLLDRAAAAELDNAT